MATVKICVLGRGGTAREFKRNREAKTELNKMKQKPGFTCDVTEQSHLHVVWKTQWSDSLIPTDNETTIQKSGFENFGSFRGKCNTIGT